MDNSAATVPTMFSRHRQRLAGDGDEGAAAAELAVLTPLLVGMLLFVVLCGRLVSAQLDLDAAAHAAARAASLARTVPAGTGGAQQAAAATLTARTATCRRPTVAVDVGGLHPGGVVTVTVSCVVPLSDLALIGVPGSRTVSSTASSPIDRWKGAPLP
jgi:Flp pilus assembly protein TadG